MALESVWRLLMVVRFWLVVELKAVRNYLFLLKEDTRDNDLILINLKASIH